MEHTLVKHSLFGTFIATFRILGDDRVEYTGWKDTTPMFTGITMTRAEADAAWTTLERRGYVAR